MDTKLLARIGAVVFVGLAIATTIVQLREEPAPVRQADRRIWVPDGDPLPAQLRACAQMGELALSSTDCRAAWAEKRRRFFCVDHPEAYSGIGDRALPESSSGEARGED